MSVKCQIAHFSGRIGSKTPQIANKRNWRIVGRVSKDLPIVLIVLKSAFEKLKESTLKHEAFSIAPGADQSRPGCRR